MRLFTSKSVFRVGMVALASIIVFFFAFRYRGFAYAITWHCFHQAVVRFGGHEVDIPRLWWVANTDRWGRTSIVRDYGGPSEAEIEVSPAGPEVVAADDVEQSRMAQALASLMGRDPGPGWAISVVTLRAKNSTWYCEGEDATALGRHVFSTLTCNAPRIPYSLKYHGPPEKEKEAESIFASFS